MQPSLLSAALRYSRVFSSRRIAAAGISRRGYASESTSPHSSFKPKAHTPLRRTASESLSIRANPKPTQSEIQPIFTLATSERYLLTRLRTRLPATARPLHDAYWVPKWSSEGREGEVFIFSNGSFVCWGLSEEDAMRFRRDVLHPAGAEVGPLAGPETEELEFATDPSEKTRLQGDLIILGGGPQPTDPENLPGSLPPSTFPRETVLVRYAFSQALSRSTALSAFEASLEDYLSSMSSLPLALEKTGKPGMGRRALIKKLGGLLRFRQGLNLNRENFSESPDFYWDQPVLEGEWIGSPAYSRYFNSLSAALEMKARTRAVNDKITYAAEVQSVLRQLLHETSSARMELVIIALIAVEVVIALIRDAPELFHSEPDQQPEHP
ncbi:hypothetical protein BJV78DRAFT_1283334 [Lactifluus subvellereus]|nr:hypothetical protein BJV78DRAFT_1283334 [Lactifluus subvellereus]